MSKSKVQRKCLRGSFATEVIGCSLKSTGNRGTADGILAAGADAASVGSDAASVGSDAASVGSDAGSVGSDAGSIRHGPIIDVLGLTDHNGF